MKTAPSLFTAAALLSLLLQVAPAQAQLVRSFVSAAGNDANSCARTAPCRTFAVAITKTDAGGEIHTLDPAGYGPVTIDKSISIVSGLGEAGVLVAAGQTGITISAGSTDVINLRGLILEGGGVGQNGIVVNSGASLNVQNSVIRGFTHIGLNFTPGAASMLSVSNTLVSDFTNASGIGINVVPAAGAVTAVLNRADVLRIGGTGVYAGANTTVVLRNSTIVGNTVGVDITNGTAVSFGNNAITGNGTNVLGGTIPEQGARGPAGPQDRRNRQAQPTPLQPQSAAAGGCTRLAS
ncbi:MAG: hypothetical protein QOC56_2223 [Alphaproteobacteria bacterium]|jgi:hypothetical protein|nr:hypothetical protein [Alphaproteobacteria bacterium]